MDYAKHFAVAPGQRVKLKDVDPGLPQLDDQRDQMIRPGAPNQDIASGHGRRDHVAAGFNAIRHHRMLGAVHLLHALN